MSHPQGIIAVDWPAPANVRAISTSRIGGVSCAPYDSLNLGDHVGDEPSAVLANRDRLRISQQLPSEPCWLQQVHGCHAHYHPQGNTSKIVADASYTDQPEQVCAVMTADCLPLLVCDHLGTKVAAIHAGWRGLCDGIIEQTIAKMALPAEQLMVWLGPAIGPQAFEVGAEVREAFITQQQQAIKAFAPLAHAHWLANIYQLARQRLELLGISAIYGGQYCTYQQQEQFFSYRRDGVTGRMASLIWLVE